MAKYSGRCLLSLAKQLGVRHFSRFSRSGLPASLPRDLPLFRHQPPQRPINSRLVASSLPFEPSQTVGIQTQRPGLLDQLIVSQPLRHRSRRTLSPPGSPQPTNLAPRNPFTLFRIPAIYVYVSTYNITTTKCSTWNTSPFCKTGWRPPNLLNRNQLLHQLRVVFLLQPMNLLVVLVHFAGVVHRAELRAAHGAEGCRLVALFGQSLVVHGAGGLGIEGEFELFLPIEFVAGIA